MLKKIFFSGVCLCVISAIYLHHIDNNLALQDKKLIIVATTSIIADTVKNIVGDNAIIYTLMGPGIDPHLYRAKESDVHKLAAADIIFYNGLHLEGKMGHVLEGMNRFTRTVAVASVLDISLLREADFEGLYDPHIWFDVSLWIQIVEYITQNIIEIDPDHAAVYQRNADEYVTRLELLQNYIHHCVSQIDEQKRILITAHDAFGYFGRAYGFTVVGLQGLSTDADISTKDIQVLADYIVEKKIKVVFVETSIPQRTILAVQNAVHARDWHVEIGDELYSDALGDAESNAADYCSMIKYNVDTIVNSLVD